MRMPIHACMYIHSLCVYAHVHIYICMYMCTHANIHMYISIHKGALEKAIYIHTG